jgi:hypothetical protein
VRLQVRDDLDALQEADLRKVFPAGASLDDVIVTDQTLPGTHKVATVSLGSTSEKVGEGGYRERSGGGNSSGGGGGGASGGETPRARRACRSRRVITLRFRAVPGARVRRVRVEVGGRRVRAKVLPGRRVRISLRGRAAGVHRVKVVAVQARGIRTTTKRTFRTCAR